MAESSNDRRRLKFLPSRKSRASRAFLERLLDREGRGAP